MNQDTPELPIVQRLSSEAAFWLAEGQYGDVAAAVGDTCTQEYAASANRTSAKLAEAAALIKELVEALETARDMLMERIHGNPARGASHNARVIIDAALHRAQSC